MLVPENGPEGENSEHCGENDGRETRISSLGGDALMFDSLKFGSQFITEDGADMEPMAQIPEENSEN
jgi:hypothetical protein